MKKASNSKQNNQNKQPKSALKTASTSLMGKNTAIEYMAQLPGFGICHC
jgi:hypothetical protein